MTVPLHIAARAAARHGLDDRARDLIAGLAIDAADATAIAARLTPESPSGTDRRRRLPGDTDSRQRRHISGNTSSADMDDLLRGGTRPAPQDDIEPPPRPPADLKQGHRGDFPASAPGTAGGDLLRALREERRLLRSGALEDAITERLNYEGTNR